MSRWLRCISSPNCSTANGITSSDLDDAPDCKCYLLTLPYFSDSAMAKLSEIAETLFGTRRTRGSSSMESEEIVQPGNAPIHDEGAPHGPTG